MANFITAFVSGLSAKEKKVLYIACGLVCLAIFDRMILLPISKESRIVSEQIDSRTNLIRKNLKILKYADKIKEEEDIYKDYYTEKGLTQEELIGDFLSEIEQIAQDSGITLTDINPVSVEEKNGYIEYNLTIECTGKMDNLLNFMFEVEAAAKPIRISSYDIVPKKAQNYEIESTISIKKVIILPDGDMVPVKKEDGLQGEITEEELE